MSISLQNKNIIFLNSAKSWGGNERWTTSAANALADSGFSVTLVCRTDIFEGKLSDKVSVIRAKFKHEADISTYKAIAKAIINPKQTILIPTKRKDYAIAGILSKIKKCKTLFRLGITREIPKSDFVQRFVYAHLADGIIVNAKMIKDVLVRDNIIAAEKVHVIYNGYDFSKKYDDFDLKIDCSGRIIFGLAGRLSAQKGIDILLQACKILQNQQDIFLVVIAGEGTQRNEYEDYLEQNSIRNVYLLGEIRNVRGFFAKCDAVLIPSRNEGVPNAMFEAWSVSKTVIAAISAGIPEVAEHGLDSLLFEFGAEQLASSMNEFIENKEKYINLGVNGKLKTQSLYSIETMAENLSKVINRIG